MLQTAGRIFKRIILGLALSMAAVIFLVGYMSSQLTTSPAPSPTNTAQLPPPSERMTPEEFELANARDKAMREQEQSARRMSQITDYMEELQADSELLDMTKSLSINTGWLAIASSFEEVAKTYRRGQELELSSEQEAIRLRFGTKLQQMQLAIFPKLRAAFADELSKRLWRQDYKVMAYHCNGARRNQCLSVSGFRLSLNSSKQEMHESILGELQQVRFNAAYYKAFSGDDGEYGWTLANIPADGDIAYRENGRYVVVLKAQQQRTNR